MVAIPSFLLAEEERRGYPERKKNRCVRVSATIVGEEF
jgi:hypothetical protein